mmetsp:Transcript_264/g.1222  ORF Transcript_264/g.1222 Transcript_264/m.1222 type:complete len:236 (-) Transcript_264:909-1616(-)
MAAPASSRGREQAPPRGGSRGVVVTPPAPQESSGPASVFVRVLGRTERRIGRARPSSTMGSSRRGRRVDRRRRHRARLRRPLRPPRPRARRAQGRGELEEGVGARQLVRAPRPRVSPARGHTFPQVLRHDLRVHVGARRGGQDIPFLRRAVLAVGEPSRPQGSVEVPGPPRARVRLRRERPGLSQRRRAAPNVQREGGVPGGHRRRVRAGLAKVSDDGTSTRRQHLRRDQTADRG